MPRIMTEGDKKSNAIRHYQENKAEIDEKKREYQARRREQKRKWREEHREELRQKARERYRQAKEASGGNPRAEYLRKWREEHPEEYAEQRQREYARKRAKKAEQPVEPREKRAVDQQRVDASRAYTDALEAARATLPENGAWFQAWCKERGLDFEKARRRSGLDYGTFVILWHGGKSIPGIALIVGARMMMTPEEVKHLGILPDRHTWRQEDDDKRMDERCPEHFDLQWWERVTTFNATKALRRMKGQ